MRNHKLWSLEQRWVEKRRIHRIYEDMAFVGEPGTRAADRSPEMMETKRKPKIEDDTSKVEKPSHNFVWYRNTFDSLQAFFVCPPGNTLDTQRL